MLIYKALNPSKLYPDYITTDFPVESALDTILDLLSLLSRILYCITVLRLIRKHKAAASNFYSNKNYRNTLSWLSYTVAVYLALFLFNFTILLLPPSVHPLRMTTAVLIRIVPALLFIFLYTLFSHNQPALESGDEDLIIRKSESKDKEKKYKSSNLSPRETRQIYEKLNAYIVQNSLHTDPDLTLKTLADQMGETTHRLSETINSESEDNFYSYINAFRLNEFITAVQEDRYPNFTIQGIALECGFKSITAFYSNFKKEMGTTPKDFIKNSRAKLSH
ncbi:MAG: helix-turn-helix domain-containing protein [Spirochaetales bacterium]|nr:helix-turn-helix domain-containing protein [Spirochaetales bacterium]